MADRCLCVLYCRKSDAVAELIAEAQLIDEDGDNMRLIFDEVNYGCLDVPEGVPYVCETSAGCEYPAGTEVSDGKIKRNWTGNHADGFVFAVTEAGKPIVGKAWQEFWSLLQRVEGSVR